MDGWLTEWLSRGCQATALVGLFARREPPTRRARVCLCEKGGVIAAEQERVDAADAAAAVVDNDKRAKLVSNNNLLLSWRAQGGAQSDTGEESCCFLCSLLRLLSTSDRSELISRQSADLCSPP